MARLGSDIATFPTGGFFHEEASIGLDFCSFYVLFRQCPTDPRAGACRPQSRWKNRPPKPPASRLPPLRLRMRPLVACWRYEPREHLRPLALSRPAVPPSPLSDRVGYSDHVRFRGYVPVHCRSGLQPPCLRFATAVTGRHARLGSRRLARLCRGRHRRRQTSTRLQGATLTDPDLTLPRHPARATTERLPPSVER
jgi:hypothetical protein